MVYTKVFSGLKGRKIVSAILQSDLYDLRYKGDTIHYGLVMD